MGRDSQEKKKISFYTRWGGIGRNGRCSKTVTICYGYFLFGTDDFPKWRPRRVVEPVWAQREVTKKKFQMLAKKKRQLFLCTRSKHKNISTIFWRIYNLLFFPIIGLQKKKRSMLLVGSILTNVRKTAATFDGNDVGRRNVILGE